MKVFVGELFFHFFIMMIIPLVNNILYKHKKGLQTNIAFLLTILVALFLTMSFPVRIVDGMEFDLKFIPVFIAFFYIGPLAGGVTIGVLLGISTFLEIGNPLVIFVNYLIMTALFWSVSKFYQRGKILHKLSVAILSYLLITGTRSIAFIQTGHANDIIHLLWFSLVSIVTLSTIVYLIETNKVQLLMMEQLQNADKMNAISQLAASVAHEIRNPMTSIRGFMQMMKDEVNLTANQKMFILVSLEELDRTHHIINDFLTLARPSRHETEAFSLSRVVSDVSDFMKPYAVMSNVNLTDDIENDLFIKGNLNESKQLFMNIVKNGIEAMPSGGNLRILAYQNSGFAIIEINDEGIGLSQAQLKQLGQPYYSTKTKGTGIGLMICFDIIKRLKGDYHIDSNEGIGTSFKMKFPM
ncbi:two-component sensor histidine kinase [Bacillus sp. FJAT-29790]|uniref:ATP-binding protein n=1 Tax=Bacillus sp. FJAT-29790 TaxID=1895002 RepID=UPI001C2453E6|nr:ATP-binding protein [Bacillus sp. FJAT-29790]MBU8878612.1 two-component sensor histidine kinase [Bacillus sp. FJAT-29790]